MTGVAHFIMAGGGTGGHVTPALAVARVLKEHGHQPVFIGTQSGMEARLAPAAGFPIEWIEAVRVKGAGMSGLLRTMQQMPGAVRHALRYFDRYRPAAVFSMGGFVAAPVVVAAALRGLPLVVMEPNAMPGAANRYASRFISRALLSFPEAERYFPKGRTEVSGVPVRAEFFALPDTPPRSPLTILITGGSQGSRTLNRAARESWKLFQREGVPVRFLHQTGVAEFEEVQREFQAAGMAGEVLPFIAGMPDAFAQADLIVSRSGAGAVAEIAAAGKAAILVPFPFAADDHQLRNAEAFAGAGAARLVLDREMTGERLFTEVLRMIQAPAEIESLGRAARKFAKPGAAQRAAEVLEGLSA
jgi:UDP-N-acetylglucosamine--N-acetylmuramyl-(pentapeptide) pyrophosphoryl-undecaprenol N-acetylglucosamine transferase